MPTDIRVVSSTSKPCSHVQEAYKLRDPWAMQLYVVADGRGRGRLPGALKPGSCATGEPPTETQTATLSSDILARVFGTHRYDTV
jgi:hypothetical protein